MGLVLLIAVWAIVTIFGTVGLSVGIAALFVMVADAQSTPQGRLKTDISFTVVGIAVSAVAVWAGTENVAVASLMMAVVVYLATVAASLGKGHAVRGLLLAMWVVVALSASDIGSPVDLALAFLAGGLIAAVGIWLGAFLGFSGTEEFVEPKAVIPTLVAAVPTPLGRYAILRAAAVGLATLIGLVYFPTFPIWVAVTVLVIMREDRDATVEMSIHRVAGTVLGLALGSAYVIVLGDSQTVLFIGLLASGFLMFLLKNVHYIFFATFLTSLLLIAIGLGGSDVAAGSLSRFIETVIGVVLALGALGLAGLLGLAKTSEVVAESS